jgi:tetratricopeptide (TPR) repeat protein
MRQAPSETGHGFLRMQNLAAAVIVLFLVCLSANSFAGGRTMEWLEKGKAAAQQGNWPEAVRCYTNAQKIAYLSPQVMYDLAVAHIQAGNELVADIWLRAYLAAVPKAANAEKVRAEIARLEKVIDAKSAKLFEQAEELADQLPLRGTSPNGEGRRESAFKATAMQKNKIGDFNGANEDIARGKKVTMQPGDIGFGYLEGEFQVRGFAEALIAAGDIEDAKALKEKLAEQKGYLGIAIRDITPELVKSLDLKVDRGVLVHNVTQGSPADKAGIKEGDVITTFDGRLPKDAGDLAATVGASSADREIPVRIIREAQEMTIPVTLTEAASGYSFGSDLETKLFNAEVQAVVDFGNLREIRQLLNGNKQVNLDEGVALKFAKIGDIASVDKIFGGVHNDWNWATYDLAAWFLSKGNVQEALKLARLADKIAEAMALRGESERAFQEIRAGKKTSGFDPSNVFDSLNNIVRDSIYMGDMPTARKADQLNDELVKYGVPTTPEAGFQANKRLFLDSPKDRQYASGYPHLGKAYMEIESGSVDRAIRHANEGVELVNLYPTSADSRDYHYYRWMHNLCDFATNRGKLAAAEKLADLLEPGQPQVEAFSGILDMYKAKHDDASVARLEQKLAGMKAELSLGWDDHNSGSEIVVGAWTKIAQKLSGEASIVDLQHYLAGQKDAPDRAPGNVATAAANLKLGLITIHALERIYQ